MNVKKQEVKRSWEFRIPKNLTQTQISEQVVSLGEQVQLSPITLLVCVLRGLNTPKLIQEQLFPQFIHLTSPSQILGMDQAVERLSRARRVGEKIKIFGDYDVDGTTGVALLSWVFREFGFVFDTEQPDRFKDGYGLNVAAVKRAIEDGCSILCTVDCGISNFDAAKRAQELGIDLIILDHHQIDSEKGLPAAFCIINPQQKDCTSGLKQLCGCSLAFYLAIALRSHGRKEGWFLTGKEPNLKQHLDLLVMATAADMVPLIGDNHILVHYGLDVLKKSKKPGIKALMKVAGLESRDFSPSHLGFVMGPRINASGRIQSASIALELLTTTDFSRALELADQLEKLNQERVEIQDQIWNEARHQIQDGLLAGKFKNGIVVMSEYWNEGVVGIVASRVTETFKKPAVVIALRKEEGLGKGSARSFGGRDVLAALRACSQYLVGFGGHSYAAGLSLLQEQFSAFSEAFDTILGGKEFEKPNLPLLIEAESSLEKFSSHVIEELERLGPFGPGNPEPVFLVKARVNSYQILKGKHLRMKFISSNGLNQMDAIWFNAAEKTECMEQISSSSVEWQWAAVPELNRFRGKKTPVLRIREILG